MDYNEVQVNNNDLKINPNFHLRHVTRKEGGVRGGIRNKSPKV